MQENKAKKETTQKLLTANLIVTPSCVTVELNGDPLEHHKSIKSDFHCRTTTETCKEFNTC